MRTLPFTFLFAVLAVFTASTVFADKILDGFIESGKYKDAVQYVNDKVPPAQRDVDIWIKLGLSYGKSGSTEKVMECYKEAQKVNPSDPKVYLAIGQFAYFEKRYQDAAEAFQRSYLLNRTALAAEGIAMAAMKQNLEDKAQDAAESAIYLDSTVLDSRLILSEIYLKHANYKSAAEQLEWVVKKKTEVKYLQQLARCLEKTGDTARLAEVDPQIAKLDKNDIASRHRIIDRSFAHKDSAAAFASAKELAILTPSDAKIFRYLYLLSNAKGNLKDATLYLKNYLVFDSTGAANYKALGDLLYEQKETESALENYRKALQLDPKIKGFYKNYMAIVLQKGNENEIIGVIKKAILAQEADSKAYIALGDIYRKRKEYAEALKMYQEALKTETGNVAVLTALGDCQAKSGDAAGAIITLEQVVLINQDASKEYKTLGDLQMIVKKPEAAIESYQKYLKKVPADNEVAKKIGEYEYDKKQFGEVIKYFELVKETTLQDADYWAELGEAYYKTNDTKKAADAFTKARAQRPSEALQLKILKPLAEAWEKNGDDQKAAEAYEAYTSITGVRDPDASYKKAFYREKTDRAIAIKHYLSNTIMFPKDYRNFLRLGVIYSEEKIMLTKSAEMLSATSVLVDTIPMLWEKLAQVYGKLGNEDKELFAYKKLITMQPQNLGANKRVGFILLKKGQAAQAISNLEIALTMDPNDIDVILALSSEYLKTKRPSQAADLLAKAKEQKKGDVAIRLQLYDLYKQIGKPDKAESELKEIIDLKKESKYRLMYAKDLIDLKRFEEAQKIVNEVRTKETENIDVLMLLASIQRAQGKFDDAIETYKAVLFAKGQPFAPALYERAETYLLMTKVDKAGEFYDKTLEADPKFGLAEYGLAKIDKAQNNNAGYIKHLTKAKVLLPDNKIIAEEYRKAAEENKKIMKTAQ